MVDYKSLKVIYAESLYRDPKELLGLASAMFVQGLSDVTLLDLCCDGGILAEEARKLYVDKIIHVEEKPEMASHLTSDETLDVRCMGITSCLKSLQDKSVEVIFGQWNIGSWLNEETVIDLQRVLASYGSFIFRVQNTKPHETPLPMIYSLNGRKYSKTAWSVGDTVYCTYSVQGYAPCFYEFKWMSSEQYRELLSPYFVVEEFKKADNSLYRCILR